MLRSLILTAVVILTAEAFAPPRFEVRSPSSLLPVSSSLSRSSKAVLLWNVVDDHKVDGSSSAFDGIEDEGAEITVVDASVSIVPPEQDAPAAAVADDDAPSEDGIDKMLNQALADSVQSVQEKLPLELQDSTVNIMEDESFKEEIAQIFDKASGDLKSALDDIRKDQNKFAQESAERSAAKASIATQAEQARLDLAEASMVKIISKVNRETAGVELAVEGLKEAQESMSSDPVMKLASGSLLKQAGLAGTILFTLRSGVDTVAMLGGDSTHAMPALVQGALALACAFYFFFV